MSMMKSNDHRDLVGNSFKTGSFTQVRLTVYGDLLVGIDTH